MPIEGVSPLSAVALEYTGGGEPRRARRQRRSPTAAATYNLIVLGQWREPPRIRSHRLGPRPLGRDPAMVKRAVFMNALGEDASPNAVREAYGANYAARGVKAHRRREEPFRLNQIHRPRSLNER